MDGDNLNTDLTGTSVNTETTVNNFDPSGLLNDLSGASQAGSQQLPEKFGEVAFDQFNTALGEASGGGIKSYTELKELLSKRESWSKMESEFNALKEKSSKNPYANEFVSHLNSLYDQGATQDEIDYYIKMQRLDLENMGDIEAIRLNMKREYPNLSDEQINEYLIDQYGGDIEGEDVSAAVQTKLTIEAKKVRETLAKLKKDASSPKSTVDAKQAQLQNQQRMLAWQQVQQQTISNVKSLPISVGEGDNAKSFEFNMDEDMQKVYNQTFMQMAAQHGTKLDMPTFNKVKDLTNRLVFAANMGKVLNSVYEQARANATQQTTNRFANLSGRIQQGSGGKEQPQAPNKQDARSSLRRKHGGKQGN